jgi:cyanophycinase-like exopeptidase
MIMCDRMIWPSDSKGEDGLAYFKDIAIVPHHDLWKEKVTPLVEATKTGDFRLVGIDECTAIIVEVGHCRVLGAGSVTMYRRGGVLWTAPAPAEMEGECL